MLGKSMRAQMYTACPNSVVQASIAGCKNGKVTNSHDRQKSANAAIPSMLGEAATYRSPSNSQAEKPTMAATKAADAAA
jgi:hypothetical protein